MNRLALVLGCAAMLLSCKGNEEKHAADCPCAVAKPKDKAWIEAIAAPEAAPTGATADLAKGAGDDFGKLSLDEAAPAPAPPAGGEPVTAEDVGTAGIPTTEIQGFAGMEQTGFRVSYADTEVPLHQQFVEILKGIELYEKIATVLNETVRLPRTIDIQLVDCGTVNAFYDPTNARIIMCNELMSYFADMFKPGANNDEELGNAILGATIFAFFHEAGHGLIHQLDLPATGKEEDAVDQFATMILIAGGDDTVGMALAGAYWFQKQQANNTSTDMPFADEHSFDGQRFYNIMCWIYGSDPVKYDSFIDSGNLTAARAPLCEEEFRKMSRSWERLLEPHLTSKGALNVNEATPEVVAGSPEAPPNPEPPPPPEPTGDEGHKITCEQVVEKLVALISAQAEKEAKSRSAEEVAEMKANLEVQVPAIVEQGLQECADKDWSEQGRRCVLASTTLDGATACGID